jgi:hypothetical protein
MYSWCLFFYELTIRCLSRWQKLGGYKHYTKREWYDVNHTLSWCNTVYSMEELNIELFDVVFCQKNEDNI